LKSTSAETRDKRTRLVTTDGVPSMDGDIADSKTICDLRDRYDAILHVDDSHSTGFTGPTGRGTAEYNGVSGRVRFSPRRSERLSAAPPEASPADRSR
jgi:glycine C-acetyltransferase